jgi:hypothetical protein
MTRTSSIRSIISLKIFLLLATIVSGCAAPRYVEIHPEVKASRAGVDISNKDSFTYPQVTVFVKGHYSVNVGDIAAGQTMHIPFDKFVDDSHKPFDVATMTPEAIRVRAWFDGKAASKIFAVK